MKNIIVTILAVLTVVLYPIIAAGEAPPASQDFTLLFSNNVNGELEPCG